MSTGSGVSCSLSDLPSREGRFLPLKQTSRTTSGPRPSYPASAGPLIPRGTDRVLNIDARAPTQPGEAGTEQMTDGCDRFARIVGLN
jgi:hypothetical protein